MPNRTVEKHEPQPSFKEDLRQRTRGHVVDCDGQRAIIMAAVDAKSEQSQNYWAVGQIISIAEGRNRVVGQTYKVEAATGHWAENDANALLIYIELIGEIQERDDGQLVFSSGIAGYPRMGSIAHRIRAGDLEAIYLNDAASTITIGHLTQEASIPAKIDLERLISRHFAVVGSTGVGKSTSVSLILRKIIERRDDLRVVILDPHNEFTAAFPTQSVVKDARNLFLPFWLFSFDEFAEVVFRGQAGLEVEAELLRDFVAEAKEYHEAERDNAVARLKKARSNSGFTADSPVPYRLVDLFRVIDNRLGQLDGKHEKPAIKALRDRLSAIVRDPRFGFMFGQANAGGDRLTEILGDIFRVPHHNRQITVLDMSALPAEVVNSVVSVLCRLAFDLSVASQGAIETLIVCEEAHRYIPADKSAGFFPTRAAIARIAKEGRKYGVYLGIVSQRPSELDATILSQCNTVFAMRLSNHSDQKIIGGAMTNGAQTSINFLSSIANRECIAFGEALKTPMRLTFETIAREHLPGSNILQVQNAVRNGLAVDLPLIVRRMRASERRQEGDGEDITDFLRGAGDQRETAIPAGLSSIAPLPSPATRPDRDTERPLPVSSPQRRPSAEPVQDFVSPPRDGPTRQSSGGELRDPPSKGARIAASIATGIEGQLRERAFLSQSPPPVPGRGPGGNALINTFRSRS